MPENIHPMAEHKNSISRTKILMGISSLKNQDKIKENNTKSLPFKNVIHRKSNIKIEKSNNQRPNHTGIQRNPSYMNAINRPTIFDNRKNNIGMNYENKNMSKNRNSGSISRSGTRQRSRSSESVCYNIGNHI